MIPIWSTIAAIVLGLERLVPFLSQLLDVAIKLREEAAKNADLRKKADADAKLSADQAAIAEDEKKYTSQP